jgi:YD repeat-containing protein
VRNTTYFKEQQNYNYDNQGLLKESSTPAGRITAALFDYNKRYAIATVTNATQGEIAYSSFEAESKGGWDYNSAKIKDGVFTTGKKCYEFTDDNTTSNISRTISGSKQYTLSFGLSMNSHM